MIKSFSLKNFRVFREKTTFNFRPITILTGPNSSGKSSLSNALYLMHKTLGNKQFTDLYSVPYELKTSVEGIHLGDIDTFRSFGSEEEDVTFGFTYDGFSRKDNSIIENEGITTGSILSMLHTDIYIEYIYSQIRPGDNANQFRGQNEFLHKGFLKSYAIYHKNELIYKVNLSAPGPFSLEFKRTTINYQRIAIILIDNIEIYIENLNLWKKLYPGHIPHQFFDYFTSSARYIPNTIENFFKCIYALIRISGYKEDLSSIMNHIYRNEGLEIIAGIWEQFKSKQMVIEEVKRLCKQENFGKNLSIEQVVDFIIEYILAKDTSPEASKQYLTKLNRIIVDMNYANPADLFLVTIKDKDLEGTDLQEFIAVHYFTSVLFPDSYNFFKFVNIYSEILYDGIMDLFTENLIQTMFFNSNSPIHSRVHRMSDNSLFVQLMKTYISELEDTRLSGIGSESEYYNLLMSSEEFINYWMQKLRIGKSFHLEYIHDSESFKFEVVTEAGNTFNLIDFGTGIRQIIFMLFALRNKPNDRKDRTILLEEPENNLHPAYQSKLADIFVHAYNRSNNLIIETHSEYLIRKLQYLVAKGECKPEHVVIYYIDHPDPAKRAPGAPQVREITLDKNGRMSHDFGPGFFDEADNLAIQLFNFNQQNPN